MEGGTYAHRDLPERIALYQYNRDPNILANQFPNVQLDADYIENLIETETQLTKTNPGGQEINAFQLVQAENTLPELQQHRAQVIQIVHAILQAYVANQILASENSRAYEQEVLDHMIESGIIRHRNANQLFTGQYIRWLPDVRTDQGRNKIRKASFFRRAFAVDRPANQIPATVAIGLPINEAVNVLNVLHEEEAAEEEEYDDDATRGGAKPSSSAAPAAAAAPVRVGTRRGNSAASSTSSMRSRRSAVATELTRFYDREITDQSILENAASFQQVITVLMNELRKPASEEEARRLSLRLANKLVALAAQFPNRRQELVQRANDVHGRLDLLLADQPFRRAAQLILQGEEEEEEEEAATPLQRLQPPFPEQPANIRALDNGSYLNIDGYFCNRHGAITGTSDLQADARQLRSKLLRSGGVITEIKTPYLLQPQFKLLRIKFIAEDKNLFYRTCIISTKHNLVFERTPQLYLNMMELQEQFAQDNL